MAIDKFGEELNASKGRLGSGKIFGINLQNP
jgi:hypothetical protein